MSFPTGASLGIGTFLEYETVPGASPLAFTRVPECQDLPDFTNTREQVEATNQDSQGFTREYIPGLNDSEEVTFICNALPQDSNQTAIWDMFQDADGGVREWRIRESTTSPEVTHQFRAFVSSAAYGFPVADKKTFTFTLRRTGPTTRA